LPSRKERKKFFDTYGSLVTCKPPPLFMVLFIVLQIAMFIFYVVREKQGIETIGQDALDSMWIYDPYKVCLWILDHFFNSFLMGKTIC